VLQALFEGGDLSEPPFVLGFEEALFGVLGHLVDAAELRWIHAQEPAARAGVLVHARRAVGAVTLAERNPAQQEMLFKLGPFVTVGDPVFSNGTQLSSPFNKRLVRGDQVFRKDGLWRRQVLQLLECLTLAMFCFPSSVE
jgi:hypothetical protein